MGALGRWRDSGPLAFPPRPDRPPGQEQDPELQELEDWLARLRRHGPGRLPRWARAALGPLGLPWPGGGVTQLDPAADRLGGGLALTENEQRAAALGLAPTVQQQAKLAEMAAADPTRRVWWIVPDQASQLNALWRAMPEQQRELFGNAGALRQHLLQFLASPAGERTLRVTLARSQLAVTSPGLTGEQLDERAAGQATLVQNSHVQIAKIQIAEMLGDPDLQTEAIADMAFTAAAHALRLKITIMRPDGACAGLPGPQDGNPVMLVQAPGVQGRGHWHATVPAGDQDGFRLAGAVAAERDARAACGARGLDRAQADARYEVWQHARAATDHAFRTWPVPGQDDPGLWDGLYAMVRFERKYWHAEIPPDYIDPTDGTPLGKLASNLRSRHDARWAEPSQNVIGFRSRRGGAYAQKLAWLRGLADRLRDAEERRRLGDLDGLADAVAFVTAALAKLAGADAKMTVRAVQRWAVTGTLDPPPPGQDLPLPPLNERKNEELNDWLDRFRRGHAEPPPGLGALLSVVGMPWPARREPGDGTAAGAGPAPPAPPSGPSGTRPGGRGGNWIGSA
jgi:hypothetical protein